MKHDAIVIGAGPNGLAAALTLADAGISTLVLEAKSTPGGGARTAALTLPGFAHDVCSTVHPLGIGSPCFRRLGLERHGLSWIHPDAPLVHVLDERTAISLERSLDRTAEQLGEDGTAYRDLMAPFAERFSDVADMVLGPLRWPSSPVLLARFGLSAVRSLRGLANSCFRRAEARALLAGIAAHAMLPLETPGTAAFGLLLAASGHAVGWPVARGGSQAIIDAMVAELRERGGEIRLEREVKRFSDLPQARAYLFDVTPKQLLRIAGSELPAPYRRRLERFRYGPGVYKMDWALRGPIPWRNPLCARSCTVHLSGDLDTVAAAEAAVHAGATAATPFVLLVQPTLFDDTRAPAGHHIAWAYCHVPHGSNVDASQAIERQIERYAPGFSELVLARSLRSATDMEAYNPNYVGGDINGGSADLSQLFFRPVARVDPYATAAPDVFLCSSSTPPGGGVHGMCGYWAAQSVLAKRFGRAVEAREVDAARVPS